MKVWWICFTGLVICLIESTGGIESCQDRDEAAAIAEDPTRRCRKECTESADCTSENKDCFCDNKCGLSCFSKDAECPAVAGTLANGVATAPNGLTYGNEANYACNTDNVYYLNGSSVRTCRSDRTWSFTQPNCIQTCPSPILDLGFAYPLTSQDVPYYTAGDTIEYRCRTGYDGSGDFTLTCQADFSWSTVQYVCTPVDCGFPGNIDNGEPEGTEYVFGKKVTYKCDTGYLLQGDDELICQSDGTWYGSPPTCNPVSCGAPDDLLNGNVDTSLTESFSYDEQIDYSCNDGYKLVGPNRGICNAEGNWGEVPTCEVDPDCDFESSTLPTCGYDVPDGALARVLTQHDIDGLPSFVLTGQGSLLSPLYPISNNTICLKIQYKADGTITATLISPDGTTVEAWTGAPTSDWVEGTIPIKKVNVGDTEVQWKIMSPSTMTLDNLKIDDTVSCEPPTTTVTVTTTSSTTTTQATTQSVTSTTSQGTEATLPTSSKPVVSVRRGGNESITTTATTATDDIVTKSAPSEQLPIGIIVVIIIACFVALLGGVFAYLCYKKHNEAKLAEKFPSNAGASDDSAAAGKLMENSSV